MSIVHVFENHDLRFVEDPTGEFEFGVVAADLATVLEVQRTNDFTSSVDKDWLGTASIRTPGGTQTMTVIWEPGVYEVLAKSRKRKAKPFQKWVFSEVLPSIRKNGSYGNLPESYGQALLAAAQIQLEKEKLEEEQRLLKAELQVVEEANEQLAEMADELFQYSSIVRIAKFNNRPETDFRWQRLKAGSNELGYEIKKAPCPRFGTKNLYHSEVWLYCYPNVDLPESTLSLTDRNLPVLF